MIDYDNPAKDERVPAKKKALNWKDCAAFLGITLFFVMGYTFSIALGPSAEDQELGREYEIASKVIDEKATEVWISDQLDSQTSKEWMVEEAIDAWNTNGQLIAHYTRDDCSQVSGRCIPLYDKLGESTTKYALTNFSNIKGEVYKSEIEIYVPQAPKLNQCVLLHEFAHGVIGMRHHWTRDDETSANSFVNNTCHDLEDYRGDFEFSDDDMWYLDNWLADRQWSPPVLAVDPEDYASATGD